MAGSKYPTPTPNLSGIVGRTVDPGPFVFGSSARKVSRRVTIATLQLEAAGWKTWLTTLFPAYVTSGFADRHVELWEWGWAIQCGVRPPPFIAVWPRGGAKSTSAELAAVAVGSRRRRSYALYICGTQDQADDHVQNIGALLESVQVERYYPDMADRLVTKFGSSKGWRHNRLRTAAGFTIDAVGLDKTARGVKLEEQRPDLLIIDDIDHELDSLAAVEKKITTLTKKLLPAGSHDVAVLAVQNLIHKNSIFSRFVDGRADFLADRIISGPYPAIEGLTYEERGGRYVITGGRATWEGQSLERCQGMVDTIGITSFLTEAQQDVDEPDGGMFSHLVYQYCNWEDVPTLEDVQVWCDPAVTDTDDSDSHGIQADGRAKHGKDDYRIYRLYSWEGRTTPLDVLCRAILKALELKASCVGVETDQGGDTWLSVIKDAWQQITTPGTQYYAMLQGLIAAGKVKADGLRCPAFKQAKAGAGHGPKTHRASQMLAEYEHGRFIHVRGTHDILERALRRFPKTKPYDLTDAGYWSWQGVKGSAKMPAAQPTKPNPFGVARATGSKWSV